MTVWHPLRVTGRFFWFAGIALIALLDYLVYYAFREKNPPHPPARSGCNVILAARCEFSNSSRRSMG
jgi:hypothetical protein